MKKAPVQFRKQDDIDAKNVQRIVEHYEAENKTLEDRIAALEARVTALESP